MCVWCNGSTKAFGACYLGSNPNAHIIIFSSLMDKTLVYRTKAVSSNLT